MVTELLGALLLVGLCGLDGVVPMIPSDAAVLAAVVLARADPPTLLLVATATALGVFVGDHVAYLVSRGVLGRWLVGRSTRVERAVASAHRRLEHRAGLLIVASRFVPGGRVAVNVACGTARMPLRRFSPASAVAAIAWAAYITGVGFVGGAAFAGNPWLGMAAGFGLSLAFGAAVELFRRRRASRFRNRGPVPGDVPTLDPTGDGAAQRHDERPDGAPHRGRSTGPAEPARLPTLSAMDILAAPRTATAVDRSVAPMCHVVASASAARPGLEEVHPCGSRPIGTGWP